MDGSWIRLCTTADRSGPQTHRYYEYVLVGGDGGLGPQLRHRHALLNAKPTTRVIAELLVNSLAAQPETLESCY